MSKARKHKRTGSRVAATVLASAILICLLVSQAPARQSSTVISYLVIFNPGSKPAYVTAVLNGRDGTHKTTSLSVPPESRATIPASDLIGRQVFTADVKSDEPVIVEEPVYFKYDGRVPGGEVNQGRPKALRRWYFAEGYTGPGFDTYIQVWNPNKQETAVTCYALMLEGVIKPIKFLVPPQSRHVLRVNDVKACQNVEFGSVVISDLPVFAERNTYFVYEGNIQGGHCQAGIPKASPTWFYAETYTGPGFKTFVSIMNPSIDSSLMKVTFFSQRGILAMLEKWLAPYERYTVNVNNLFEDREMAIVVESENGIPMVAERVMYFNYAQASQITGGASSAGVERPGKTYYFAEGYTSPTFDELILFGNTTTYTAHCAIEAFGSNGKVKTFTFEVPPERRKTLNLKDVLPQGAFSLRVTTDTPITVDRTMYFTYNYGINGGHTATGIREPALEWFFNGSAGD